MYVFVSEDHMSDWHSCQICYPLEMKLLLLLCTCMALFNTMNVLLLEIHMSKPNISEQI